MMADQKETNSPLKMYLGSNTFSLTGLLRAKKDEMSSSKYDPCRTKMKLFQNKPLPTFTAYFYKLSLFHTTLGNLTMKYAIILNINK